MGMEQGGYTDDSYYEYGGGEVAEVADGAYYGGGDSFAIDYANYYADEGPPASGDIPYAEYYPGELIEPAYEPLPIYQGGDLFGTYFDYYSGQGYDDYTAMQMAAESAGEGSIQSLTTAPAPPPDLPDVFPYFPLPVPANWDPLSLPPYITPFDEGYYPLPPPPGETPTPVPPNLPPACPGGQYHPYPIGHPQQNICIPFPTATTPGTQKMPGGAPSGGAGGGAGGGQAPKPPAQTQPKPQTLPACPTGYKRDPWTLQCVPAPAQLQQTPCPPGYYRASTGQCLPVPKCTTPGTVFDTARGLCVPAGQAVSPLPASGDEDIAGDVMATLKQFPWWIWVALAGLFLLSQDKDGRKTTVTYRRA